MTHPNVLVFVDFPSSDVNEARFTPRCSTGRLRTASPTPSLALCPVATSRMKTARPAKSAPPTWVSPTLPTCGPIRTWTHEPTHPTPVASDAGRIMVSEDDSFERILETVVRLGGTELWRALLDRIRRLQRIVPRSWGNQIMLWQHLPDTETDDDTHEVVGVSTCSG